MGLCANHPERETSFICMKHDVFLCEACLACRDPNLYCTFRTSCVIWFSERETRGRRTTPGDERSEGSSTPD